MTVNLKDSECSGDNDGGQQNLGGRSIWFHDPILRTVATQGTSKNCFAWRKNTEELPTSPWRYQDLLLHVSMESGLMLFLVMLLRHCHLSVVAAAAAPGGDAVVVSAVGALAKGLWSCCCCAVTFAAADAVIVTSTSSSRCRGRGCYSFHRWGMTQKPYCDIFDAHWFVVRFSLQSFWLGH